MSVQKITDNPDKTRILMLLLKNAYGSMLYDPEWVDSQRSTQPPMPSFLHLSHDSSRDLKVGDLVIGQTSMGYNDFLVGFVHEVVDADKGILLIREIGSDRVCNYSNERFLRIDKKLIGYEILEGQEYKLYHKVLGAFEEMYAYRFGGISFDGKKVTVRGRRVFSDDIAFTIEFTYNSKTSIKSIREKIQEQVDLLREARKAGEVY